MIKVGGCLLAIDIRSLAILPKALVVSAGNAPASSGYRPVAGGRVQTPLELRDNLGRWPLAKSVGRTEHKVQSLRRSDSDNTTWFVALAEEQLALIANNGFHNFSFC